LALINERRVARRHRLKGEDVVKRVNRHIRSVAAVSARALVVIGLTASWASAQSATANLGVSATVVNNCTISTTAVAFGNYDPVVANALVALDGTGTVTVACTKGAATTIGLGLGQNASGAIRRMTDGTDFLTYELYNEGTRTTVWTDAGPGLLTPAAAPSRAPRNFTVYGRVAGGQDVQSGPYADTVVATVNF
jgi:spore coat protein U-like protein